MTAMQVAGAVVTLVLLGYLLVALVKPERLQ